jgi:hypothetical protein
MTSLEVQGILSELPTAKFAGNSIARRIAIGVTGLTGESSGVWASVELDGDTVTFFNLHVTNDNIDPSQTLGAEIFISANFVDWIEMARQGYSGVVDACDKRLVLIGGSLPYFIRHVRSLVNVASNVSLMLANRPGVGAV